MSLPAAWETAVPAPFAAPFAALGLTFDDVLLLPGATEVIPSEADVSASLGMTSVAPGSSSTSSKVRPRAANGAAKGAGTAVSQAAGKLIFRFYGRHGALADVPLVALYRPSHPAGPLFHTPIPG